MPGYAPDLVLCAKGIEAGSGRTMHEVAAATAPDSEIAVLSGPTFAHEVAAGLPTAVTLACGGGEAQWQRLAPAIARPAFRPYYSDDLIGAEVGGAVKNVLAIACGVVDGLRLGQNARAALIARGYAEMQRFGDALGAQRDTLAGLCGLGDLVLTCSSTSSRNFSLGKALGQGGDPTTLMSDRRTVAEGAHTAPVLLDLARRRGIDMPITEAVVRLLDGAPAQSIAGELLARPLTTRASGACTPRRPAWGRAAPSRLPHAPRAPTSSASCFGSRLACRSCSSPAVSTAPMRSAASPRHSSWSNSSQCFVRSAKSAASLSAYQRATTIPAI